MTPVSAWAPPGRPPRAGYPPASRGSASIRGFEDEHGNLAGGPLLVFGVRRVGSYRALPPLGPFLPGDLPGDHVLPAGAVLEFDERVGAEVVVPARVGGGSALRRDRGITAVMLDPHHRCLAELAAARPAVGDDHHRQPGVPQRCALRAPRALVKLDLVTDPGPRAWPVLTFNRHAPSQHPRCSGPPAARDWASVSAGASGNAGAGPRGGGLCRRPRLGMIATQLPPSLLAMEGSLAGPDGPAQPGGRVPISDEKIGDFLDRLAGRVPVPGGGAAAALHAAQGAALLGMVARYTTGSQYEQHGATIGRIIAEVDELRAIALRLADADADAFTAVSQAYQLPSSSEEERAARSAAIARALVQAAWPPAQVISVAGMVVDLAEALAAIGNRYVISDVAAAAEAARAAAATARVNIEINLASITDEQAGLEMIAEEGKADAIITRAEQVTAAVRDQIRA